MKPLGLKCRVEAERRGLVGQMNDTKWRELCFAFSAFKDPPSWRTLDLLTKYLSDWDREWFHHVGPDYCTIHWLEIEPGDTPAELVRSILNRVGVPFEEFSGRFRVVAYG